MATLITGILALCFSAYGQESGKKPGTMGVRISSILTDGRLSIETGLGFAPHWSIGGEASVRMKAAYRTLTEEETGHYGEFQDIYDNNCHEDNVFAGGMNLSFWPIERFKGLYISIGGRYGDREDVCAQAGIGYFFRIWKRFHCNISFMKDLLPCWKSTSSNETQRIGISINIVI